MRTTTTKENGKGVNSVLSKGCQAFDYVTTAVTRTKIGHGRLVGVVVLPTRTAGVVLRYLHDESAMRVA